MRERCAAMRLIEAVRPAISPVREILWLAFSSWQIDLCRAPICGHSRRRNDPSIGSLRGAGARAMRRFPLTLAVVAMLSWAGVADLAAQSRTAERIEKVANHRL